MPGIDRCTSEASHRLLSDFIWACRITYLERPLWNVRVTTCMAIMPCKSMADFREASCSRETTASLLLLAVAATSFLPACATRVRDEAIGPVPSGPVLSELFRLGDESTGDSLLFGGIGELVAVDRAGRIFVGEDQDPKIYAFTASGALFETIGQRGSGPGEFERLGSILVGPGDTLYAFDSRLERMSAFEPDSLNLAYDFTVFQDSLGLPSRLVGALNTGFLVTFGWPITPGDAMAERRSYVMRVEWAGQAMPPPVHYLAASEWLVSGEGEDRFAMGMPFGRDPVFRMGPGGRLYSGWTESVDIAVTTPDGLQSGYVTHALASLPLTREEIERYVEGRVDWYSEAVLEADLPATKPAYETFVVDDRARIWIKATPPSVADTTAEWHVLDAESRLLGQLRLPATTNLRVVRGGRAYAEERSDEPTLVVYQIQE